MRLTLTLRQSGELGSPPEVEPAGHAARSFERFPVRLGRSAGADWTLPDPSRYVSNEHALVVLESGSLFIEDASANGTFVNGSTEPIGRGKRHVLTQGDVLAIGHYSFDVEIDDGHAVDTRNPTTPADSSHDPFRNEAFDWSTDPGADPFADLTGLGSGGALPRSAADSSVAASTNRGSDTDAADTGADDWFEWLDDMPEPVSPRPPVGATPSVGPAARETAPEPRDHAAIERAGRPDGVPPGSRRPARRIDRHRGVSRDDGLRPQAVDRETSDPFDRLLSVAGVDPASVPSDERVACAERAGALLKRSLAGLIALLELRGELKDAIRSDVTRLAAVDNNPLKFGHDPGRVTQQLIRGAERGFLDGPEAIDEAIGDLARHHLAMLDGMEAAVRGLMSQFDPAMLEKILESTSPLAAAVPLTREARLWTLFREHFERIRDEAVDGFGDRYGEEFRRAYERRQRETKIRREARPAPGAGRKR